MRGAARNSKRPPASPPRSKVEGLLQRCIKYLESELKIHTASQGNAKEVLAIAKGLVALAKAAQSPAPTIKKADPEPERDLRAEFLKIFGD